MGKYSAYAAKASPTASDKLLIDDVADLSTPTGMQKVITLGQVLALGAGTVLSPSGDTTGAADTTAVNAALASFGSTGGTVSLRPGTWYVNAPLTVPAGCRLAGQSADTNDTSAYGATIKIVSTWAQGGAPYAAAILCGLDSVVDTLNLNAQFPAFNLDGIYGSANCVHVHDINIYGGFNNGVTPAGLSWRVERVTSEQCYTYGFWGINTDADFTDCIANANTSHGWFIQNPINSRLIACRSEWNNGHGYYVTGDGTATGGCSLIGCSTDRNALDGLHVDSTGNWPVLVSGMMMRRDGRSGGTNSAINVVTTATSPVIINGLTVYPGFNDDGTGTQSPITGITIGASATFVSVDNAIIHAVTTPISGTITQAGANVATRTGAWNSPSAVTQQPVTGQNLLISNPATYANGTFVGVGDSNQYSNFNLADGVYPLDAAGHYWAFSHRKLPTAHELLIFNYNGSVYTNVLALTEAGKITTAAGSVLDDSTGNMTLAGGLAAKVRTITTSGAVAATDSLLLLNAATLTATLPTAVGITGRQYTIKLIAASTGTVATTSSQTIDGATTYSLTANHKYVTVVSDGANWQITANN